MRPSTKSVISGLATICGHEIEIAVDLRIDTTLEQDKILESVVA
jgi:hypothetical protein